MKILLTNDDGYFAAGLRTMYDVLAADHQHEIYVVAPEGQRSAVGRSITLFQPIFVTHHSLPDNHIGVSVNGTPTDCVKLAIQGDILPAKPDLIISGINHGPNLGSDVFYSGTVAAAMEGALLGIRSIAVSLANYDYEDYMPSALLIKRLIDTNSPLLQYQSGLLNINVPPCDREEWKGKRVTRLGRSVYDNAFENRKSPYGREYYWITGTLVFEEEQDTDLRAIQEGYVSITPLHCDLTDYERLKTIENLL
ncbi:MAG: 5'/3'-nucleotidase SurE [Dehalobacter sp. 4CP]|uniref:5'/3'-nucleotidase SurE n=1 Tax=Dehalobacter sp. CP TaxID=2594474 RepID=UPI0013C92E73|nr:5'/3'-nucleotidase SurE [Dehalobacter sp.]NBJ16371.1 5'/3'-nucleotidase SurE [Dehalobacter sp. 4CP]